MSSFPAPDAPAPKTRHLRRFLPVAVLVLGLVAYFLFGLDRYLSFEALRQHRMALLDFVAAEPLVAPLFFTVSYALAVAFSLPAGLVLSITGGFLFGTLLGTLLNVIGATVGAAALFLIARSAFGAVLRARAGPFLNRMADGFRANALSYLLALRLVPLFPFFIVNLVPAFLGVGFGTYVLGTFLGIIPAACVFASVGAGLGSLFDAGERFTPLGLLTPEILTALCGLALLAVLPVAYKAWRRRRGGGV
ncbi:MAG: TVP38/TMEM64 family protein [Alphaproteobacteria bacterium]|nr:TVP38/TMEM64 family protein [Alphaproteobacteria bacterium]